MKTCNIALNSIQDVKDFVAIMGSCLYEADLVSGRYVIDAKSIMGIFSLDLSRPIQMNIHSDDCADLLEKLDRFIVK